MLTKFTFEVDDEKAYKDQAAYCEVCNERLEDGDDAIVEDCSPNDIYYHADCYGDAH